MSALTDQFKHAKDLFNRADYHALGNLFHPDIVMIEVDSPNKPHTTKDGVVSYLISTQTSEQPRFDPGDETKWKVTGETGTNGKIEGHGGYQNSSTRNTPWLSIKFTFEFVRSNTNERWLLKLADARIK
jgi:hypothetical protein